MKRKDRIHNKIRCSEHAYKRTGGRINSSKSRRETAYTRQSVGAQRWKQAKRFTRADTRAGKSELANVRAGGVQSRAKASNRKDWLVHTARLPGVPVS